PAWHAHCCVCGSARQSPASSRGHAKAAARQIQCVRSTALHGRSGAQDYWSYWHQNLISEAQAAIKSGTIVCIDGDVIMAQVAGPDGIKGMAAPEHHAHRDFALLH